MLRTIHLYGHLKKEFGPSFRFDVATAGEALRALNCAFPVKFVEALQNHSFKLVRGDKRSGMQLDMENILGLQLGSGDLHLMPIAKGASSSSKGTTKVVLGAALIGGAIFFSGGTLAAPLAGMTDAVLPGMIGVTYGNMAMIGLGLTLAGASTLLTKPVDNKPADQSSAALSGGGNIGNSGKQGDAVQLIYGEVLTGSTPISVSSDVEDIDVYADQQGSIEQTFGQSPAYWSGQ